jgi:hypothetical protein
VGTTLVHLAVNLLLVHVRGVRVDTDQRDGPVVKEVAAAQDSAIPPHSNNQIDIVKMLPVQIYPVHTAEVDVTMLGLQSRNEISHAGLVLVVPGL